MTRQRSEARDSMQIDWDLPIEMEDGLTLRADVFRPISVGEYPVIMTHGPYGKWYRFKDRSGGRWEDLAANHPEFVSGTTANYQAYETVDPEEWVPDGYAIVRVDSRGAGRSPGYLDVWSDQEARDYAECIEWAGQQPWSTGKVGLNGISYYAMNQWQVASLQPDHLTAMCVWEGAADWYRDLAHHGGIYCTFAKNWYQRQVVSVQHGLGTNGERSRTVSGWVSGPETLTPEELGGNRADLDEDLISNKLATAEYWQSRKPDWSKVDVPFLSAANWGDHGLHTRGNFEGFMHAASDQKWLEVHGRAHWTEFYTNYGVDLQKRFFGHFLQGNDTGWDQLPRVLLRLRHESGTFIDREEDSWPLERTDWTRYHLDADAMTLSPERAAAPATITYDALGSGVTFLGDPLEHTTEITGPISATVHLSSDTRDADLFLVVRVFDDGMEDVVFQGAADPNQPIALGWLRASHRKLDVEKSTEWRPYHAHDEIQPLTPGVVYELHVEILPTSIVAEPGSRLALSVRGKDPDGTEVFRHDDPRDRPSDVYGGEVTIHTGPDHPSLLLLPIIPPDDDGDVTRAAHRPS